MPESSPPRMLSAPLRLTAMTLRGLGPYLHGARLEIKPLTILCGENGSGKSTWIEAIWKLWIVVLASSAFQNQPDAQARASLSSNAQPSLARRASFSSQEQVLKCALGKSSLN